jgi:hypothetical protein
MPIRFIANFSGLGSATVPVATVDVSPTALHTLICHSTG